MKTIKQLENEIENKQKELNELNEKLKEKYFSIIDDIVVVKNIVLEIEKTTNVGRDSSDGWPCSYIFISGDIKKDKKLFSYIKEYLSEYHGIYTENDSFILPHGPGIIIQDNGTVWDQDSEEIIIEKNEYSNEEELFEMIENYMKKTGCFPGVYRADYYGEILGFINTQKYKTENQGV
jgi:hypothetical protein